MIDAARQCRQRRNAFGAELAGDAAALAEVRSRLRSYLATAGVPVDVVADVILAAQEAATNALRFGGRGDVELLVWTQGGEVRVRVKDRGKGFAAGEPVRCARAWQTQGRGLYLMQSLMDDVSIDCSAGTTVSMRRRFVGEQTTA